MRVERYAVVGLARVRSPWFGEVASWANAGVLPIDFIKCVSTAELRARLHDARGVSAILVEAGVAGFDRDLIDEARTLGVASIVVGAASELGHETDWARLGAAAVLPDRFDEATLIDTLSNVAEPISSAPAVVVDSESLDDRDQDASSPGSLIAVIGSAGSGTSTTAMALAQGLARQTANASEGRLGSVVLADLVRRGHLAMYHDAKDVVPGFQELVESHRNASPTPREVAEHLFDVDDRGYALLLGLRRTRDWTALRPKAVEASIESLRSNFDHVVADLDAELDGEAETGSVDVEERNAASRLVVRDASLIVITTDTSLKSVHEFLHLLRDLADHGVCASRILPVVTRAPRSPRQRAECTRTLSTLGGLPGDLSPVFVPAHRHLEAIHANGAPLPQAVCSPLVGAVRAALCMGTATARTSRTVDPPGSDDSAKTAHPATPRAHDSANNATTALVSTR